MRIKGEEVKLKAKKPGVTPEKVEAYERELAAIKEKQPMKAPMVRFNIGTAMLLVLLFLAVYLIAMLIHRWLVT